MTTEDVLLEDLVVELLGFGVVAGEALLVVGDEETAVAGTLQGTEHTGAGGRAPETDIEVALEGTGSILVIELAGEGESAIGLLNTLVLVREAELGQSTTRAEKTSRVS